jgi:anthranilate synthase component 1
MITELEFKSLASQGYQSHSLDGRGVCGPRNPFVAVPQAGAFERRRPVQLPARIRGGWRAFWPLQLHRPARAHAGAGEWLRPAGRDRSRARRRGRRDRAPCRSGSCKTPLDFIADYQKRFKVALRPGLPRFCGGLAGYFGYDTVRYIEKKLEKSCPPDTLGCPDILLLQCEELAVIDNLSGKLYLIVYADPDAARRPTAHGAKKRLQRTQGPAGASTHYSCARGPADPGHIPGANVTLPRLIIWQPWSVPRS